MPPRTRNASGYRGVRLRPNGTFYAEIRSGDERLSLGTYDTAHEAARTYDAAAWRLGRPRRRMNFDDVWTAQQAQDLAPPSPAVTQEARVRQREQERRLLAAERAEHERLDWAHRFPEDVAEEVAYYAERRAQKDARIAAKKKESEARRAKAAAKKKKRDEADARRQRRAEARRNGAGPAIITVDSSSDEWSWSDTPVSSTTTDSSDFDFDDE